MLVLLTTYLRENNKCSSLEKEHPPPKPALRPTLSSRPPFPLPEGNTSLEDFHEKWLCKERPLENVEYSESSPSPRSKIRGLDSNLILQKTKQKKT